MRTPVLVLQVLARLKRCDDSRRRDRRQLHVPCLQVFAYVSLHELGVDTHDNMVPSRMNKGGDVKDYYRLSLLSLLKR